MSETQIESPLVDRRAASQGKRADGAAGVVLQHRPFLGHIALRGKDSDGAFVSACAAALGCELPTTPNTYAEGPGVVVAWMGPTEWLLMVEGDTRIAWLSALRDALAGQHAAVVDLSGGQTVIEVSGIHARDMLAKGCLLDLHPREAGPGFCTRSLLARSAMFIRVIEAGARFEVVVRRSFADYLWQWLVDAADEYRYEVAPAESRLVFAGLEMAQAPRVAAGA